MVARPLASRGLTGRPTRCTICAKAARLSCTRTASRSCPSEGARRRGNPKAGAQQRLLHRLPKDVVCLHGENGPVSGAPAHGTGPPADAAAPRSGATPPSPSWTMAMKAATSAASRVPSVAPARRTSKASSRLRRGR